MKGVETLITKSLSLPIFSNIIGVKPSVTSQVKSPVMSVSTVIPSAVSITEVRLDTVSDTTDSKPTGSWSYTEVQDTPPQIVTVSDTPASFSIIKDTFVALTTAVTTTVVTTFILAPEILYSEAILVLRHIRLLFEDGNVMLTEDGFHLFLED